MRASIAPLFVAEISIVISSFSPHISACRKTMSAHTIRSLSLDRIKATKNLRRGADTFRFVRILFCFRSKSKNAFLNESVCLISEKNENTFQHICLASSSSNFCGFHTAQRSHRKLCFVYLSQSSQPVLKCIQMHAFCLLLL